MTELLVDIHTRPFINDCIYTCFSLTAKEHFLGQRQVSHRTCLPQRLTHINKTVQAVVIIVIVLLNSPQSLVIKLTCIYFRYGASIWIQTL